VDTKILNGAPAASAPPGVYFTTSADFIRGSKPASPSRADAATRAARKPVVYYGHFSLIDPNAKDLSCAMASARTPARGSPKPTNIVALWRQRLILCPTLSDMSRSRPTTCARGGRIFRTKKPHEGRSR
jgi:hypothetical protein